MNLADYLNKVPLLDHHCHFLIDGTLATRPKRTAMVSSEADSSYYPLEDTKNRLAWWEFQAEAKKFSQDFDPMATLTRQQYQQYCKTLFDHYRYRTLLIDTGFVPADAILDLKETATLTNTTVYPIYRLETAAQAIMQKSESFEQWWQALYAEVKAAKADGYVGFKSIAAYRFGLKITEVSTAQAQQAFEKWKKSGVVRLSDPQIISYLVWNLAPLMIEQDLPLQFHVGYGDADTDMYQGNPLLLREFLQEWCLAGLKVVLLHCYPYHREAGYLASVFPNLYFDISLIDPLGPSAIERVLDEALELAPYTRFLFASDASTSPEMYGVAARRFKDALLAHFEKITVIGLADKKRYIDAICWQTSAQIYGIREDF